MQECPLLSGLAGAPAAPFREPRKMPSLSQILAEHSPLLLVDAASARIQVGLLDAGAPARWSTRNEEAGTGIFECLDELGDEIDSIRSFAYCEGPGSILGIRSSAMAIRVWNVLRQRPTFGYIGLAVVARALGRPGTAVIADARRGQWHRLTLGGALERVPGSELSGELATPEGFRHWEPLPAQATRASYDLAALFALRPVADADLFRPTGAPDAFLHEERSYAKWVPQIHRAP
jgi:tRNA threonylcarbamoyladenosine biosynthesis protein TsaB